MKTVYLSSAYLAPVQYYSKLLRYDRICIEQYDHYEKQSYRNRCVIASPQGELTLSIPVVKPAPKCAMKDVRISDHGNWRRLHWNALEAAYNNTPFFEYYKDDFHPFYERRYEFLADFNEDLFCLVGELIDLHPQWERTSVYKARLDAHEVDLRDSIHPKRDFRTDDPAFSPRPYYQVFESRFGFLPNLSIVDLLFNMGPESLLVLR